MFWLDNLNILTIPVLIPDINMTFEEKLNSIIRGLLFLGIIFTLVFNDSKYILFVLIIMIISIIIYNYQYDKNKQIEKYLNENNLDIINNKKCIKPTKANPFMNPNILDRKYDKNNNMSINSLEFNSQGADITTYSAPAKFIVGIPLEKLHIPSDKAILTGVSTNNSNITVNINTATATAQQYNVNLILNYDAIIEVDTQTRDARVRQ